MNAVLNASGLSKAFVAKRNMFGRPVGFHHAVRDVDLTINRGETVAVVGESGAGKSTLGRLILRLIEPDSGSVEVLGKDVLAMPGKELRDFRSQIRMIFQDPYSSLDPSMIIGDIIAEPLKTHTNLSRDECHDKVLNLLERVGMGAHHMDRFTYEFSGGQLQRIAIARAIATEPDLIVCDEPVAALDMSIRAQVINLLRDLQEERGMAYMFVTHDLSLVQLIADRVVVMYHGRVVETAPTEELFDSPRHPYTQALLAAVPVPDVSRRQGKKTLPVLQTSRPLENESSGCDFVNRCAYARDSCASVIPELVWADGHEVACHLDGGRGLAGSSVPAVERQAISAGLVGP